MRIVWGDKAVRWFKNTSEFTGYNKKLAEILLSHIPCRESLCDVGCGAGLIDMELAPYIEEITCVDINPEAVKAVEQTAGELGIENISAFCMDATKLDGRWNTVMGLFYGGDDFFTKFIHMAKDRLILVTHGSIKGEFGPEGHQVTKCFGVKGVSAYLDSLGVKYHLEEHALEYGQPFSDLRKGLLHAHERGGTGRLSGPGPGPDRECRLSLLPAQAEEAWNFRDTER